MEIVSPEAAANSIKGMIYVIRGQQVMLDSDLASLYGYDVKAMNQRVKRNIGRFPDDFMFQLTKQEVESVKSQFVTSRKSDFFAGQEGGRRKLPFAFAEQGIYMLATVLKGETAEGRFMERQLLCRVHRINERENILRCIERQKNVQL